METGTAQFNRTGSSSEQGFVLARVVAAVRFIQDLKSFSVQQTCVSARVRVGGQGSILRAWRPPVGTQAGGGRTVAKGHLGWCCINSPESFP